MITYIDYFDSSIGVSATRLRQETEVKGNEPVQSFVCVDGYHHTVDLMSTTALLISRQAHVASQVDVRCLWLGNQGRDSCESLGELPTNQSVGGAAGE